jgi:lactobin A/cerein 7B family class IIb bacteriocin
MREITQAEIEQVSGGLAPLAIIGIDLALNAVVIAYAAFMTSDYMTGNNPRLNFPPTL